MYANQTVGLIESLIITVFSMVVVFATLYVISLILGQFHRFAGERPAPSPSASPAASSAVPGLSEDELLAVVSTVLAEELQNEPGTFCVRNIREIEYHEPIWPQQRLQNHRDKEYGYEQIQNRNRRQNLRGRN